MKANEFLNEDGMAISSGGFAANVMPLGSVIRRQPKKKKKRVEEMDSQQPTGRLKADGTRSHSTYGSRDRDEPYSPEPRRLDVPLRRWMIKKLAWETDIGISDLELLKDDELEKMYFERVPGSKDMLDSLLGHVDTVMQKRTLKNTMESIETESKSWEDYGMPTADPEPKKKKERRLHGWLEWERTKEEQERADAKKAKEEEPVTEAPIELDPSEPTNPMIYGHDKANPAKLDYRMLRAAGQFKDLASRVRTAQEVGDIRLWSSIVADFKELAMNVGQISHALEELEKTRRKGGVNSRGIPDLS